MFFMLFIIRAGIQILADHPRLCWGRDGTPGTEWLRFQHEVPKDRIWTAKDDDVATGKLRWVFQGVHHDLWVRDVPAQPSLVDLTVDGATVPALVAPTK